MERYFPEAKECYRLLQCMQQEQEEVSKVKDKNITMWQQNESNGAIEITSLQKVLEDSTKRIASHARIDGKMKELSEQAEYNKKQIGRLDNEVRGITQKLGQAEEDSQIAVQACMRQRALLFKLFQTDQAGVYSLRPELLMLVKELNDQYLMQMQQCSLPGSLHIYAVSQRRFNCMRSFSLVSGTEYKATYADTHTASSLKIAFYDVFGIGIEIQLALNPGQTQEDFLEMQELNDSLCLAILRKIQNSQCEEMKQTLAALIAETQVNLETFQIMHSVQQGTLAKYFTIYERKFASLNGIVRIPETYGMNNFYSHKVEEERQIAIKGEKEKCNAKIATLQEASIATMREVSLLYESHVRLFSLIRPQARDIVSVEALEEQTGLRSDE